MVAPLMLVLSGSLDFQPERGGKSTYGVRRKMASRWKRHIGCAPKDERAIKIYISGGSWSWQRDGFAKLSASRKLYPHFKSRQFQNVV